MPLVAGPTAVCCGVRERAGAEFRGVNARAERELKLGLLFRPRHYASPRFELSEYSFLSS